MLWRLGRSHGPRAAHSRDLQSRLQDNLLPADFFLVGFGRKAMPDDEFRLARGRRGEGILPARARSRGLGARRGAHELRRRRLRRSTATPSTASRTHIDEIEKKALTRTRPGAARLFYISTPPSVFAPILQNLGASGLASKHLELPLHSKVIIDKPFGHDLESARALNATLRSFFEERQVYRIDHYLGKETVQDLLVQAFRQRDFRAAVGTATSSTACKSPSPRRSASGRAGAITSRAAACAT